MIGSLQLFFMMDYLPQLMGKFSCQPDKFIVLRISRGDHEDVNHEHRTPLKLVRRWCSMENGKGNHNGEGSSVGFRVGPNQDNVSGE